MKAPRDPEEATATSVPAVADLPPQTRMGEVELSVASLDRSIAHYEKAIGLRLRDRVADRAHMGTADEDLLVLIEQPGVLPARGWSGLYHYALLVPRRRVLARWLAHAARDRVPLTGLSDHFVSEAIYLNDPDGHGIEIYWDRPREVWEGQVAARMTTEALDVHDLLGELDDPASEPFDGLPVDTVMGHVHFKVAGIEPTVHFYRDVLGFGLMAALGPKAAFLSAGGYHHHIGANTWESAGRPQGPEDAAKLRQATIVVPDAETLDRLADQVEAFGQRPEVREGEVFVTDPSGNPLLLRV